MLNNKLWKTRQFWMVGCQLNSKLWVFRGWYSHVHQLWTDLQTYRNCTFTCLDGVRKRHTVSAVSDLGGCWLEQGWMPDRLRRNRDPIKHNHSQIFHSGLCGARSVRFAEGTSTYLGIESAKQAYTVEDHPSLQFWDFSLRPTRTVCCFWFCFSWTRFHQGYFSHLLFALSLSSVKCCHRSPLKQSYSKSLLFVLSWD